MRLQDKVAIITGGGQGIGRTTALLFAREGAKVVVADVNEEATGKVVEEITAAGGSALSVKVNVTQADSVNTMVAATKEWGGGHIDILVNNAGITRDALLRRMTEEEWDAVINVNLKGVWLCGRAVGSVMREQGSGSIINASSIVGVYGNAGQSNYSASKGGVIAMTYTWAIELGPRGVRVNAIAPGFIVTPMTDNLPKKILDRVVERTPLRRLGQPEDIANVYLFLASDESSFITGQVIQVGGGFIQI